MSQVERLLVQELADIEAQIRDLAGQRRELAGQRDFILQLLHLDNENEDALESSDDEYDYDPQGCGDFDDGKSTSCSI